MFAGHFGLAGAVKAKSPEVPLWALMISTQLLDVVFVPLYLTGVETIEGGTGYGESVIHANYSHSLIGALLIALLAGLAAWRFWGKKSGQIIGAVVFSHWLLDLLVHRADLPILPNNIGDLPLLGFGFWGMPVLSIALEAILIALGLILYIRSVLLDHRAKSRGFALVSFVVMGVLLVLSLLSDVSGIGLD